MWREIVRQVWRVMVVVAGLTLLLIGAIMLVTPGAGWLMILAGLGVLALEFVWARLLVERINNKGRELARTIFESRPK